MHDHNIFISANQGGGVLASGGATLPLRFGTSVNAYLIVLPMTSYLTGLSVAQNKFNRLKFDEEELPRSRRNLIPFLF